MGVSFRFSRRIAMLAAGVALVSAMGGGFASAQDAGLVEAAKKEGSVTWYTTLVVDQAVRPLAEAWSKKYPDIELQFSRASSTDQALKLTNEAQAGRLQGDVFDGSSTIFPLLGAGLVEPYKPASAADYPADFRAEDGMWTALNAYFLVTAFNPQNLDPSQAPKAWNDLLDPKFKGQIAWATDESADGPAGFVGMILQTMGEEAGKAYLQKLAAQGIAQVPANQRVMLDQVIAGEYQIGLMSYNHHIAISQGKGAPVEWAKIDPAWATRNYLGLVKGSPHPNAARLLIEYLLSEEGQSVLREANYIPVHPKVPPKNPALRPDTGGFKYVTVSTDTIQKSLAGWNATFREIFH